MELTEKERKSWIKFKASLRPEKDRSETERIIIEMSNEEVSTKKIRKAVSCGSGVVGKVRLSARRRGIY